MKMLRRILLAVLLIGFSTSAFAATHSIFDGGLFGGLGKSRAHVASGHLAITVDISTQEMTVVSDGRTIYTFDVSTGRKGYGTPTGNFRPIRMHKMWYSSK